MIAFVSHPVRFKIDDCMGERIGVQLSEFRLLSGDKDVTPLRSGFSHGEGMDSSERSPIRQAVDGDLNTEIRGDRPFVRDSRLPGEGNYET